MKHRKIILGFLILWCFTVISCVSRAELMKQSVESPPAVYKYDWIVFENNRLLADEEFKAYVEEQVKGTNYIDIKYDPVERLHKTYIIRAWVFYKKEN